MEPRTINLYRYKKHLPHTRGEQETWIIDATVGELNAAIPDSEFVNMFGGYLVAVDDSKPQDKTKFKGVWGRDIVRKMKQTLNQRGFEINLIDIEGSERSIERIRTTR